MPDVNYSEMIKRGSNMIGNVWAGGPSNVIDYGNSDPAQVDHSRNSETLDTTKWNKTITTTGTNTYDPAPYGGHATVPSMNSWGTWTVPADHLQWEQPATEDEEPVTLEELLDDLEYTDRRARAYKVLPYGDVDVPAFCMRCGVALTPAAYPAEGVVFSPHTGKPAKVTECPNFAEAPEKHDAWVVTD